MTNRSNRQNVFLRNLLFQSLCFGAVGLLAYYLMASDHIRQPVTFAPQSESQKQIEDVVAKIDASFKTRWTKEGITPADHADNLTIARRLSLGLAGTIPAVEEIREFQQQAENEQIHWWISRLLEDDRTSSHLAERFARAYVGVEQGPFLVFRRRRFTSWLSEKIKANQPYDQLVYSLMTDEGLWTDTPSVNFYTKTITEDNESRPDPILLAGRTSRAFLGMRIDCLQCHDDFLGNVNLGSADDLDGGTQLDFHSLAAYFNQTENSLLGIRDSSTRGGYHYKLLDEEEESLIEPRVPFHRELIDNNNPVLRQRLADWVTHPKNKPFARATVNRVWAIMFGRALMDPVDDIPLAGPFPESMEILANDFVANDFDLHRLIRIIAATKVFQLSSQFDTEITQKHEREWALFPLIRLRPDQVSGAIAQSTQLATIDHSAHILTRLTSFGQQNDFVQRFGDPGEDEFDDRGETVTQRLLMLNGDMIGERLGNGLNVPGHLMILTGDPEKAVEVIYLSTLTRFPNAFEKSRFAQSIGGLAGEERNQKVIDVYWTLINSAEFRWNH